MAKIRIMDLSEYVTTVSNVNGCEVKKSFTDKTVRTGGERFAVGDMFTIPNEFSVLTMTIGDNNIEYMPIRVKDSNGNERYANLFPSMLWKFAFEVDENGNRMNTSPVVTSGSVYNIIKNYPTLNSRLEQLKGYTIKVTNVKDVRTLRFGTTNETYITPIYTFDFIDNQDETIRKNAQIIEAAAAI